MERLGLSIRSYGSYRADDSIMSVCIARRVTTEGSRNVPV
jgi:hypothetical protein